MTQPAGVMKSATKAAGWFDRFYPIILCACRFILAVTQFSVALDTFYAFKELSRLREDVSGSLSTIADSNIDVSWVPTLMNGPPKPAGYGQNKFFNYYIIRVVHFLNNQVSEFVFYPSLFMLCLMMILCAYDLFSIYQTKYSNTKVKTIGFWLRNILYLTALPAIIMQAVVTLLENGSVSHMEVLYPFLFAYGPKEKSAPEMLLKTGARSLKGRLLATFIFNIFSLVPDTYLILVNTIQPLRLYVIVNSMKIFASIIVFSAVFMGAVLKHYVTNGLDPKLMSDKTTINILKHNQNINVGDLYPNTGWTVDYLTQNSSFINDGYTFVPVFDLPDSISSRVRRSTKLYDGKVRHVTPKPKFFHPFSESDPKYQDLNEQKNIGVYSYIQNSFDHIKVILKVFIGVSSYVGIISLALAICNFLLVLKRHKLLLYINVLVDFVAMALHACNAFMAHYPVQGSDFFCEIKEYIPSSYGVNFESMVIYSWLCRSKELFTLVFAMIFVMGILCVGNLVVLYLLWS